MDGMRIDLRKVTDEERERAIRETQLCFKINHTMPYTKEYDVLVEQLFQEFGEDSRIMPMVNVVRGYSIRIGKRCVIMNNCLFMGAGGITIEDDCMIAANCQIISNNHDPLERWVLLCKPVHICQNVWLGAGSTILPGVTIGANAIIGASAVVTKDVPANAVVAGIPARIVKYIV